MRFKKPVADGRTTWSVAEEETIRDLTKQGKTLKDMKHIFPKRSDTSIKNKIRKIRFKENNYGAEHRQEKYDLVAAWLEMTKPSVLFEGFAGEGNITSIYLEYNALKEIHACEIKPKIFDTLVRNLERKFDLKFRQLKIKEIKVMYGVLDKKQIFLVNGDSQKWASHLYGKGKKFDFVDLDTCGTVLPGLQNYIRIVNDNGFLAVTFGEFLSYRFGRKDALIKSNPLLFEVFLRDPKSFKKITLQQFYNRLIGWVCLLGSQTIAYKELKLIKPKQEVVLGRKPRGVYRVLFDVKKSDSLASILNNASKYLKNA
ncbi:MAG TPA: hypothetical protein VJJ53_03095 [Candidatus Nanoarchaeia archaeon]|nr:hypothetical protein [Candidatus Nanoarchaeia archaeon]